ncbi:hypothetical protein PG994_015218 [Apiospora phragmitis]|uniref:Uncharacterized protein n=1 Tax=Apiospora phragmitis TaxID=2905665 RepID=A0ABR1SQX2_9PEZI
MGSLGLRTVAEVPGLLPLWGAAAHTTTPDPTFAPTHYPPYAGFHLDQGILGSSPPATADQMRKLLYKVDMLDRKVDVVLSELKSHTGELERWKQTYQELFQQHTRRLMGCLSQLKKTIVEAMGPSDANDDVGGM